MLKGTIIFMYLHILISLDTPAQEVTSSLQGADVCPGDRINFTCTAYSSSILAWQSKKYLGTGVQVEFLSANPEGTKHSKANTSAVLDSVSSENGTANITSTMLIVVEMNSVVDSREQSVSCINVDIGTRQIVSFEVAGPGIFTLIIIIFVVTMYKI